MLSRLDRYFPAVGSMMFFAIGVSWLFIWASARLVAGPSTFSRAMALTAMIGFCLYLLSIVWATVDRTTSNN